MKIRKILFSILLAAQPAAIHPKMRNSGAYLGAPMLAAAPLPQRPPASQKVIKDPQEYRDYMTALRTPGFAQKAAAMEAFVARYPDSTVKVEALEHAMAAYQQAGNAPKVEEVARRILEIAPFNARALAVLTFIDRAKAGSGDSAALQEGCGNAQKGLTTISRNMSTPKEMTEESGKLRAQMEDIFYGAAGFCALSAKDYNTARDNYQKALQINPDNMQDNYQIGTADVEMNPIDVNGFWYLARAINLADSQNNPSAKDGIAGYASAKYKLYHGTSAGWDQIVAQANQISIPPNFTVPKAPNPADLAVQAVQQHDPATLSITDQEFVLQYRDASPANKEAADKVWQAILKLEKNGQEKLKIPVKVIAATRNAIQAAMSEDNQAANKADLNASMEKPLEHLPAVGSNINIYGVITSYTPQPFSFTMNKAELNAPQPTAHSLSEDDIETLLRGGVSTKRVTELVKEKGVNFALDNTNEARLKKAGATEDLLVAIAMGKK